jgi:hypothetical protein
MWFCSGCFGNVKVALEKIKTEASSAATSTRRNSSSTNSATTFKPTSSSTISLPSSITSSTAALSSSNASLTPGISSYAEVVSVRLNGIRQKVNQVENRQLQQSRRRKSEGDVARVASGRQTSEWVTPKSFARKVEVDTVFIDSVGLKNKFNPLQSGKSSVKPQSPGTAHTQKEILIVGDSQVRYIQSNLHFGRSKVHCHPGARVSTLFNKVESLKPVRQCTSGKGKVEMNFQNPIILHAGGNNIMRVGSEDTIADYERLLHSAGDVSNSVVVTSIAPRYSEGREWSSRAIGINARLESLCTRLGMQFIDLWDKFYGKKFLYAKDGTHFSRKGVATLGRLIDDRLYNLDRLELEGNF